MEEVEARDANLVTDQQDPTPFEVSPIKMCATSRVKIALPDDHQRCYDGDYEVHILCDNTEITMDSWLHGTDDETNDSDYDDYGTDDHISEGEISDSDYEVDYQPSNSQIYKAYWRRQRIIENSHGHVVIEVWRATVLQNSGSYWVITNEEVALKCMSREHVLLSRGSTQEDFVKEIAALQYLSEFCNGYYDNMEGESSQQSHVMTANTIMADEAHAFIVMPYCANGDILTQVFNSDHRSPSGTKCFTEATAKYWFKQMLAGLRTLQNAHLCHRDLSPENFILSDNTTLVIDFGMCLRIPYTTDGRRHRITRQARCGKAPHRAPEIQYQEPFDGHAVDIWATGTVLLYMLQGTRGTIYEDGPTKVVNDLSRLVEDHNASGHNELGLSFNALDLLCKMFQPEPENRLTLDQICAHPFVQS